MEKIKGMNPFTSKKKKACGKNHLLLIAIDEYKYGFPKLDNCESDVEALKNILLESYQFDAKDVYYLIGKDATRLEILNMIKELRVPRINEADNLIIVFSGHGETVDDVGYLVPYDAKVGEDSMYVSSGDIKARLDNTGCKHILMIVDACFSGAMFRTSIKSSKFSYEDKFPSRWGISSCHNRQLASDGTMGKGSPFAISLIEYLSSRKDSVSLNDISAYIKPEVQRITRGKQIPRCERLDIRGDETGVYIFQMKDALKQKIHEYRFLGFDESLMELIEHIKEIKDFNSIPDEYLPNLAIVINLLSVGVVSDARIESAVKKGFSYDGYFPDKLAEEVKKLYFLILTNQLNDFLREISENIFLTNSVLRRALDDLQVASVKLQLSRSVNLQKHVNVLYMCNDLLIEVHRCYNVIDELKLALRYIKRRKYKSYFEQAIRSCLNSVVLCGDLAEDLIRFYKLYDEHQFNRPPLGASDEVMDNWIHKEDVVIKKSVWKINHFLNKY